MGAALALHAGLLLLLLWVLRPAQVAAIAGDAAGWFDLGLAAPGGGGEVPQQLPGPGAPPAPVAQETEAPDALSLPTEEEIVAPVPIDSLDTAGEGESTTAVASGAGTTSGAGGQGGQGGGSGGGSGGGIGPGQGPGVGGRGGVLQPLHLVVPRLPRGVDSRAARGRYVVLLVEVRGDGRVADAKVDRSSGVAALDQVALVAARGTLYRSRADTMAQWTRLEIRF